MSILTERGSLGLKFISQSTLKPNDFEAERNTIRCFKWSDDGKQLVYCNNQESIVVRFPDWEVVTRVSLPLQLRYQILAVFITIHVFSCQFQEFNSSNGVQVETNSSHFIYITKPKIIQTQE